MMNKWLKGMAAGVLALGLAACGSTAEPKTDSETGEKANVTNKSEMTAQEVYNKAMSVSEEQKNMHAVVDVDQKISVPSEDFEMDSKIKMDMDMIVEPLSMYQKMSVDMGPDMGKMDMELYLTDSEFYMQDPESGEWLKFTNDMYDEIMAEMGGETDPTLDMEMFNEFKDDFKFEQTDDEYILTLSASGEKFNELMLELMNESIPEDLSAEEAEIIENMNVNGLTIEIFIDKETFYTNAFNLDMDMDMKVEEQEMNITQKMKAVMSKINEIDEIVVPQEVVDNAIDLGEM